MGVQEIEHKRPNYRTSGTGPYDKEYSAMVAYGVFTRERTTNQAELDTYARKAPGAAKGHNLSFLALYGKHEVLEGPTMEGAAVLRFPTIEEARRWYDSPAYQEAAKHRHAGAEYRVFIVEGAE
jgi:uncharacterized protein (DUF1330 family)